MNRTELKKLAKEQLKDHWKIPVISTLILALFSSIFGFMEPVGTTNLIILILYLIISLFVSAYISIWVPYFYLKFVKDNNSVSLGDIIILPSLIWRGIKAVLLMFIIYSLMFFIYFTISFPILQSNSNSLSGLFIVLTIIFALIAVYIQTILFPFLYIVCEYKHIGILKCFKEGFKLMKGHKFEYIILCLSFIGWNLLAILTFGIGFLWLTPYINTTLTNYYLELKNNSSLIFNDAIILE